LRIFMRFLLALVVNLDDAKPHWAIAKPPRRRPDDGCRAAGGLYSCPAGIVQPGFEREVRPEDAGQGESPRERRQRVAGTARQGPSTAGTPSPPVEEQDDECRRAAPAEDGGANYGGEGEQADGRCVDRGLLGKAFYSLRVSYNCDRSDDAVAFVECSYYKGVMQ
jgi:hypothetical protein